MGSITVLSALSVTYRCIRSSCVFPLTLPPGREDTRPAGAPCLVSLPEGELSACFSCCLFLRTGSLSLARETRQGARAAGDPGCSPQQDTRSQQTTSVRQGCSPLGIGVVELGPWPDSPRGPLGISPTGPDNPAGDSPMIPRTGY